MCYADRFAGDLRGVTDHIEHLRELGVTYLHLMPLLARATARNDGGHAVADYGAVDPLLGDMADLRDLAAALHIHDIGLCVDLVVNHTAREHGVDVLRLDAVPFRWKRTGTDCQNQPEARLLLQALRALVDVAAPGVVSKAEAIVPPAELVQYLGRHELEHRECDLACHNRLVVMLWSAVVTRDARLPTHALSRMRTPPPHTSWMTYVRCHDDIGWAVTEDDAGAVGLDRFRHRDS